MLQILQTRPPSGATACGEPADEGRPLRARIWSDLRRRSIIGASVVVGAVAWWQLPGWLMVFTAVWVLWAHVAWSRPAGGATVVVVAVAGSVGVIWAWNTGWHQLVVILAGIVGWWIWVTCPRSTPIWQHVEARIAWVVGPVALLALVIVAGSAYAGPRLGQAFDHWRVQTTQSAQKALTPHVPSVDVSGWLASVKQHMASATGGGQR